MKEKSEWESKRKKEREERYERPKCNAIDRKSRNVNTLIRGISSGRIDEWK